jgi:hypothetical protein
VGKFSGTLGDLSNTVAIGYNATATASNQIQLGNNEITDVKTSGNMYNRKYVFFILPFISIFGLLH